MFYRDGEEVAEAALLTPTPLAECPVKEVVTVGIIGAGASFLESVSDFNRQSEDFNISVINYRIGGRSYQEAQAALKLDLSIGKGPDFCDVTLFDEPEALYASGCFEDLSTFFEESQQYKRADFIEQALNICTWQNHLLAIPKYFSLWTIAASPDIAGQTIGWNMEDMKAIIESHPDAVIFDDVDGSYVMTAYVRNMLDELVDFENKKANFDAPEYIDFLKFVSALPDNYKDQERQNYNEGLRDGRTLFARREIRGLDDFQEIEADFGGKYTCVGYPSPDRTPDTIIRGWEAYAISAASDNKERAWKFLEWFHAEQGEEGVLGRRVRSGFPTRIDVFERELEEAMGESGEEKLSGGMVSFYHNGTSVNYRKTTPEEAELLRVLIESASPERSAEQTILGIMEEEAVYLFDGSKTAEDVAAVTQNRVQLYLDEE